MGWFRCVCVSVGLAVLAGCGSAPGTPPRAATLSQASVPFAQGPIASACLSQRRSGASRARCGCVQAAADLTLSEGQQSRAVPYFADPHLLQEVRQSDRRANERFWADWRRFAETAEQLCRRT